MVNPSVLYGTLFTLDGTQLTAGVDAFGCDWTLTQESGWFASPPIKQSRVDLPTSPGMSIGPEYKGGRIVALSGELAAPDVPALRQAQRRLFGICPEPDQFYPLVATEEDGLVLSASVKLDGQILTVPKSATTITWSLQVLAADPRKFGPALSTSTPVAGIGGTGVKWGGPTGATGAQWAGPAGGTGTQWGTPGTSGVVALDNSAGIAPTSMVAIITTAEDVPAPSIVNTVTGETVTYGPTIHNGDILRIDFGSGSVLLNGVNQRPNLSRAEFFDIPAETALPIRFEAASPAATATLTATFSPAYY